MEAQRGSENIKGIQETNRNWEFGYKYFLTAVFGRFPDSQCSLKVRNNKLAKNCTRLKTRVNSTLVQSQLPDVKENLGFLIGVFLFNINPIKCLNISSARQAQTP